MAHVAKWKEDKVKQLTEKIEKNSVVGVVNITGIPAPAIQKMRADLRGKAELLVTKNSLISIALKKSATSKPKVDELSKLLDGQCAVIATNMNPFKLYKFVETTKTKSPAKGGETAPEDIVVKAGETSFKPGPIVGELQRVGIPAAIDKGKVVIKKDKLVVSAGQKIPRELAGALTKLEIYPITVGLNLLGAYEQGMVYKPNVLAIDETQILNNVKNAGALAFNLAMYIGWATKFTREPLVQKAYKDALSLAIYAGIVNKTSMKYLLSKAYMQMLSLASKVPNALDDELKNRLSSAGTATPQAKTEVKEEKKGKKETTEEKPVSEEDAAAGLSALFG